MLIVKQKVMTINVGHNVRRDDLFHNLATYAGWGYETIVFLLSSLVPFCILV